MIAPFELPPNWTFRQRIGNLEVSQFQINRGCLSPAQPVFYMLIGKHGGDMAWSEQELGAFRTMRDFYRSWIADIEAGKDTTTRRILGELVDERAEMLDRYRRNADELDGYLADT